MVVAAPQQRHISRWHICRPTSRRRLARVRRETSRSLALVCILKDSVLQQQGLLEYNFACFRDALFNLFHLRPPIDIV